MPPLPMPASGLGIDFSLEVVSWMLVAEGGVNLASKVTVVSIKKAVTGCRFQIRAFFSLIFLSNLLCVCLCVCVSAVSRGLMHISSGCLRHVKASWRCHLSNGSFCFAGSWSLTRLLLSALADRISNSGDVCSSQVQHQADHLDSAGLLEFEKLSDGNLFPLHLKNPAL